MINVSNNKTKNPIDISLSHLLFRLFQTFFSFTFIINIMNMSSNNSDPLKFWIAFDVKIDNPKIIETINPNFSIFLYIYSPIFLNYSIAIHYIIFLEIIQLI